MHRIKRRFIFAVSKLVKQSKTTIMSELQDIMRPIDIEVLLADKKDELVDLYEAEVGKEITYDKLITKLDSYNEGTLKNKKEICFFDENADSTLFEEITNLEEVVRLDGFTSIDSFIDDNYFEAHIKSMVDELNIPSWVEVDLDGTADNIKVDYKEVEILNTIYHYRG